MTLLHAAVLLFVVLDPLLGNVPEALLQFSDGGSSGSLVFRCGLNLGQAMYIVVPPPTARLR